jgi:hypothetical protein
MRLFSRDVLLRIEPFFSVGDSWFGPEMTLLSIAAGARVMEIPVNYRQRVGESMVTGNRWTAFAVGLRMIAMITKFRIRTWTHRGLLPERLGPRSRPKVSATGGGVERRGEELR